MNVSDLAFNPYMGLGLALCLGLIISLIVALLKRSRATIGIAAFFIITMAAWVGICWVNDLDGNSLRKQNTIVSTDTGRLVLLQNGTPVKPNPALIHTP